MNNIQAISKQIFELTLQIEQDHPELYRYLDESPIDRNTGTSIDIGPKDFQNYLIGLRTLLQAYLRQHQDELKT